LGTSPNYNYSLVATFTSLLPALPYSYLWNSTTSPAVNNLNNTTSSTVSFANCNSGSNPAYFYVTVTDANGCQASQVATVNYVNGPPDPGGGGDDFVINTPENYFKDHYQDRNSETDVNGGIKFFIEISPNPNSGTFNISIQSPLDATPNLYLIDLSGRVLHTQSISIQEGFNQIEISKPELPSGIYFIKVDGFDEQLKMIIAK
jgi:hypothetical protein